MKTLKELREHGINYLIGYTDALKDFAQQLIDNPDLYDSYQNMAILKFMNDYISELFKLVLSHKEETNEISAAN